MHEQRCEGSAFKRGMPEILRGLQVLFLPFMKNFRDEKPAEHSLDACAITCLLELLDLPLLLRMLLEEVEGHHEVSIRIPFASRGKQLRKYRELLPGNEEDLESLQILIATLLREVESRHSITFRLEVQL